MIREDFGTTSTGETVERVTLSNADMTIKVLSLGAILQTVHLTGQAHPMCLSATTVAAYQDRMSSYGSLIGPVANRITNASFTLDGTTFPLEANQDGTHSLHSGSQGTHKKNWTITEVTETSVTLSLSHNHLSDGFPGNRIFTATYSLEGPSILLTIEAQTDQPTVVNFAHHPYWNLDGTPTFKGHTLQTCAETYLPTTPDNRPTGDIVSVEGTDFDFRKTTPLNADAATFFDHNLCLSQTRQPMRDVATLTGTKGVALTISTTETGLQIYDGATINTGDHAGHHGTPYAPYEALALETQSWPDAPTHSHFPSIRLDPNDTYRSVTRYHFAQSS